LSQTWRSDQPIHGGDHQTFEMKKTVIRPFVSHLLDPSNSLTPKIEYSTCFLSGAYLRKIAPMTGTKIAFYIDY
jgi:hypothetical protein